MKLGSSYSKWPVLKTLNIFYCNMSLICNKKNCCHLYCKLFKFIQQTNLAEKEIGFFCIRY